MRGGEVVRRGREDERWKRRGGVGEEGSRGGGKEENLPPKRVFLPGSH